MKVKIRPAIGLLLVCLVLALAQGCQRMDQTLFDSAQNLLEDNKYDEAMNKLMFLVSEYPDSPLAPKAHYLLGEVNYFTFKKPELALENFVHAAKGDPSGPTGLDSQRYIAEIYLNHMRNPDLAILQYQKILVDFKGRIKPDEYHFQIGKAYLGKGDFKQAIIEFQTLLEKFPATELKLDTEFQIANSHLIGGDPELAAQLYSGLLRDNSHSKLDFDLRLGLAMSYEDMEKLSEALDVYYKMEKRYPKSQLIFGKIESITKRIKDLNKDKEKEKE